MSQISTNKYSCTISSWSHRDKSLAMNRALKTGTNLRDAKKTYDDKLPQISKVPAMNSFCLYLKISMLSFMNKALKMQPSIYWGRLTLAYPSWGFMFHYLHLPSDKCKCKFFDFSVRRSCQFSHSPKTRFCVFFLSLTV